MSEEQHQHHAASVGTYVIVYVLLVILLGATVGVSYLHLGIFSNLVAVLIASVKAVLVVLYFMGVRYSSRLVWLWAAAGFLWVIILFGAILDYMTRGWTPA